ncbi:MAG: S-layer homology domain-containing protein, partial [Tissierellia bacterium]|nr:S-layer homology domain-containing protein [Tissierellia bacterium]
MLTTKHYWEEYYEDIQIAIGEGYISGYEDNTVRPNRQISRQEAATIISRALGLEAV